MSPALAYVAFTVSGLFLAAATLTVGGAFVRRAHPVAGGLVLAAGGLQLLLRFGMAAAGVHRLTGMEVDVGTLRLLGFARSALSFLDTTVAGTLVVVAAYLVARAATPGAGGGGGR